MALVATLTHTIDEPCGELYARCANSQCGHRWVIAHLPMLMDRIVELSKRAACPKCGDTDPLVLPSAPRTIVDDAMAARCPPKALIWISGPDVGLSSRCIWLHMMGTGLLDAHYPKDPDDLIRCLRLLLIVPEWKPRMHEMAMHGPVWAALVQVWDELTHLMEEEVGLDGTRHSGMAPRTYARMIAIRDPIEGAA